MNNSLKALLILCVACGGGYAVAKRWPDKMPWGAKEAAQSPRASGRPSTGTVTSRNISFAITAAGEITPAEQVQVRPEVSGRIDKLPVEIGDIVKKGDLLFTVDDDLQKADVVVRNTAVINAQQAFDRAKELLKSSAGTQKTYDDAEAALRQAKANLEWAQTRLARRTAHSPADATVEQIYYRPGETVPAGRPGAARDLR